jgi:heme exporter protein A
VSEQATIVATDLTKVFGARRALDRVGFELPAGAFLSIFGPNGAGKTTLLRILSTLARPTSGNAQVLGFDLKEKPGDLRAHIGLISHKPLLYLDLSAEENLLLAARLYGVADPYERVGELLATVELTARRHDVVRTFSRGMTQRLAIARALVHDPQLVFLDEPYSGLDPRAVQIFDELLHKVRQKSQDGKPRSFCMVSHDMDKGLALATHLLILERGKVVLFARKEDVNPGEFARLYLNSVGMGVA